MNSIIPRNIQDCLSCGAMLNIFIGKNFIIAVNRHRGDSCSFFGRLDETINHDMTNIRKGPDFLLHMVLDYTVDRKFEAIEALQDQIDEAEENILRDPAQFKPDELMHLRRFLLSWSMITGAENWKIAYPLYLLAMVAIGALNYLLLTK